MGHECKDRCYDCVNKIIEASSLSLSDSFYWFRLRSEDTVPPLSSDGEATQHATDFITSGGGHNEALRWHNRMMLN